MLSYNRPNGGVTPSQQSRCSVVHWLTRLLCGIGCIYCMILTRRQAPRLDESFEQGEPGAVYAVQAYTLSTNQSAASVPNVIAIITLPLVHDIDVLVRLS